MARPGTEIVRSSIRFLDSREPVSPRDSAIGRGPLLQRSLRGAHAQPNCCSWARRMGSALVSAFRRSAGIAVPSALYFPQQPAVRGAEMLDVLTTRRDPLDPLAEVPGGSRARLE